MFPPDWRPRALAGLGDDFDLVVIGGGINGSGILLDAAQRGLRTLLVEKGDIARGTSSRSSKLIHGGLRYLAQGQVRTTWHSSHERDRMVFLQPHLVSPIRFTFPVRKGDPAPPWKVGLGLSIYDRFSRQADHRRLEVEERRKLLPGFEEEGLRASFIYGDATVDDARLTLAVAATGVAYGGLMLTGAEVLEGVRDGAGRLAGLRLEDTETGRSQEVRARVVVNAAGPWADEVRHRFGLRRTRLRPSRGSHILLPTGRLPLGSAVALQARDGRVVFVIPHVEGLLVGTTDLYHSGDLDDPRPTAEEVGYLLQTVADAFPEARLTAADVVGAFAGLRPLIAGGSDDPTKASRDEELWLEDGLLTVAGGKLTTWRITARRAVDRVVRELPRERREHLPESLTGGTALAGVAPADLHRHLEAAFPAAAGVAAGLARRLGALAWDACRRGDAGAGDFEPLLPELADEGLDLSAAELRTHLRHGAVLHLDDLLLRRARLGLWRPGAAEVLLPRLRELCAEELGWDAPRFSAEVDRLGQALEGWSFPRGGMEAMEEAGG